MSDEEFNKIWEEKLSPICMEVDDCECCPVSKECVEITLDYMGLLGKVEIIRNDKE